MAEAGFAGASYGANVSPASSVTYYGNFGNSAGAALGAHTTEAEVELVHRGADITMKNLRVVVTTNGRAANSSVTTRKNNADTSQVATITASTTGTYTDLTNTVSYTAGDKVAYKLVIGSTSGSFMAASITVNRESSGQAGNSWSAIGSASTTNASSTRYWNVTGAIATPSATEANFQSYLPAAGTISNLRCYVTAARATNTTFKSRVGGADGAMSVTLTASTTGAFEDTTNSDSVSAGNLFCVATVTGTGTDSLTLSNISVRYATSTANVTAIGAGSTSATLTSGVTRYYSPLGNLQALSTESSAQQIAPFAGTAAYLCAQVTANASTTTTTMVLRKGGTNTAVTYTIAGGATGSFVDTSNSVSVSAGDLLSIQGSGSDGTVTFRSMGLRYTAAASADAAGSATVDGTASGVGASTAASAGTGTATGAATGAASAIGSAAGSASAGATGSAVGASTAASAGSATAGATASGVVSGAGDAAGSASAGATGSAVGSAAVSADGSASAGATASGAVVVLFSAAGSASAGATASGGTAATANAAGSATATVTAVGVTTAPSPESTLPRITASARFELAITASGVFDRAA